MAELKRYVREQQQHKDIHPTPTPSLTDNALTFESAQPSIKFANDNEQDLPYWEAEEVKDDDLVQPNSATDKPATSHRGKDNMPQSLDDLERDMIRRALQTNNGRRKAAADQLGISERTLYRKSRNTDWNDTQDLLFTALPLLILMLCLVAACPNILSRGPTSTTI